MGLSAKYFKFWSAVAEKKAMITIDQIRFSSFEKNPFRIF